MFRNYMVVEGLCDGIAGMLTYRDANYYVIERKGCSGKGRDIVQKFGLLLCDGHIS